MTRSSRYVAVRTAAGVWPRTRGNGQRRLDLFRANSTGYSSITDPARGAASGLGRQAARKCQSRWLAGPAGDSLTISLASRQYPVLAPEGQQMRPAAAPPAKRCRAAGLAFSESSCDRAAFGSRPVQQPELRGPVWPWVQWLSTADGIPQDTHHAVRGLLSSLSKTLESDSGAR